MRYDLNDDWLFFAEFGSDIFLSDEGGELVRLPHSNVMTPFHYFNESAYQFVSGYKRTLLVEKEVQDKRYLLTFAGAAHVSHVYVNGTLAGEHLCGYTAFTVDITDYLVIGNNSLVVKVNSKETSNVPPFGNVIDYMTYGGIYREVYLDVKDPCYIKDLFVKSKPITSNGASIETDITLAQVFEQTEAQLTIRDMNEVAIHTQTVTLSAEQSTLKLNLEQVTLWSLERPYLYTITVETKQDSYTVRFGVRSAEFREDGFFLNGEKVKIVGLNRHQSYPYVGYAMPKSMQELDADILKNELFVNAVRTSHYPQSKHFVNRCDELGLLVFTEIPGWQYIGDAEWQDVAVKNVSDMVLQYRNHPSIILWGVRINESEDDDAFYERTNDVARMLDETRQTGGVRDLAKSNLLEDVYTYNDFSHRGFDQGLNRKKRVTSNRKAPYLITEYNGHMYPTKSFDDEAHRTSHMLRYANVLDALFADDEISGAFGWCMFDYNTHRDFGSGDRVCYHGVMDMFRNPKLAASVFAVRTEEQACLEISSTLNVGEHAAGLIGNVYAITNADSIRVYRNDAFVREYTHEDSTFRALPRGPILIDDFIGDLLHTEDGYSKKTSEQLKACFADIRKYGPNHLPLFSKLKLARILLQNKITLEIGTNLFLKYTGSWGQTVTTYRFDAIKNGQVVKSVVRTPMTKPHLELWCSHQTLIEDSSYDVAAVRIKAVDEHGNLLPYYAEPILLRSEGDIEIIGPEILAIRGGYAGIYVKSTGTVGNGTLHIGEQHLSFTTEKKG